MAAVVAIGAIGAVADGDDPAPSSAFDSQTGEADEGSGDDADPVIDHETVDDKAIEETSDKPPKPPKPVTYQVASVTDGDTLILASGDSVRIVGIDAPEIGDCGSQRAEQMLSHLTLGERVVLEAPVKDRDRYDRLLRYVDVGSIDVGLRLIRSGLAIARYDSRDGYEHHARQDLYVRADAASRAVVCAPPPTDPVPFAGAGSNCAPGYSPCIPSYPPDLDCADTGPVAVTGSDPHGLDADDDGIACGGD